MDDQVELDPSTVKLDLLTDHVNLLVTRLDAVLQQDNKGTTQTVIHQHAGMQAWGVAAVVACFFTFLGLILFAMVVIPELHDLKAWSDIYRSKIYTLEKGK